jgi:putative ABC transport system permease protein
VTGVALSPEFIYALGPGDLMPDDRRFGIIWMPEKALAAAYDLTGAFSNLLIKLVPGASAARVTEQVDRLLERYGGEGAYGRKDQQSHAFLDAELNQLRAMSRVLPPIFLTVAAFLVNMTLSRLIALEREQIGLLKALGYSSWAVARHYIAFVSLIAAIGIVIGIIAGIWLGNGMTRLYARFFHFPFLVFSRDPSIYFIAAAVTLGAAVAGAAKAVSDVAWLPPAVAMSPPPPPSYRKFLPATFELSRWVSQSAVMVSRHLTHWPWRSLSSVLGVAFAVAILSGSMASYGAVRFMIDFTFQRAERQDASITFTAARPMSALFAVEHMPGIMRAEPFRAVPVKIRFGNVERRLALTGKPRDAELSRLMTADLVPVTMPEAGVALSRALANILHVKRGELVEIERLDGDRRRFMLPVSAIIDSYVGLSAAMDLDTLNHALGEGAMISGAHVSIDPARQDQLFAELKATPTASFVALEREAMAIFSRTVVENITTMVTTYTVLAAIIAFGVVYNFARIALSEQGRELASLRVLGFSRAEVSRLLLAELGFVVLAAQPIGWLIGAGIWYGLVQAFANELYRMPFIVNRDVFAYASLISIMAAAVSALAVKRRIDRLDMIAVLKTRE